MGVVLSEGRPIMLGRDTCSGACETRVGCGCITPCPPCNQRCNQGRQCPANTPAEACTDLGVDEERSPLTSRDARTTLVLIIAPWAAVMAAVWVWQALSP